MHATGPVNTDRCRRPVWCLPRRWQSVLVSVCLRDAVKKRLAALHGRQVFDATARELDAFILSHCGAPCPLARDLQRHLDGEHEAELRRCGRLRGRQAVLHDWRQRAAGVDAVSGVLWAAWTHPDVDRAAGTCILNDLCRLHGAQPAGVAPVAAGAVPAAACEVLQLMRDNARLRRENAVLRRQCAGLARTTAAAR